MEMINDVPLAFLLTGPSGSGKSTAREALLSIHPRALVASSDDELMRIARERGISYQEAYANHLPQAEESFKAVLKQARDEMRAVIIDRTNLNPGKRRSVLDKLEPQHSVICVIPDFDVKSEAGRKELLRRAAERTDRDEPMPAHVIEAQIAAYEPPTPEEGFDAILTISRPEEPADGPSMG